MLKAAHSQNRELGFISPYKSKPEGQWHSRVIQVAIKMSVLKAAGKAKAAEEQSGQKCWPNIKVKQKHSTQAWDDMVRRKQEETAFIRLEIDKDTDKCFENTGWKVSSVDLKTHYQLIN